MKDFEQQMEDKNADVMMEESDVDEAQSQTNNKPKWANGQCVLAIPSHSFINPSFDLSLCSPTLERKGFQIPNADIEVPLKTALDVPSVRRFMIFNSSLFHFIMAPFLYVVLWCAVFSTLRLYMTLSDYWILCLCVSLISIFLTTVIIFVLNRNKKEININLDVRLIPVNETMVKHKLLVAVADWVDNCKGSMQLYFVYWDMARCLQTLTETLEEHSLAGIDTWSKLKKKMSHLVLVAEVPGGDCEENHTGVEESSEEQRPLLKNDAGDCTSSSSWKVTTNYSLVPDASLPAQTQAHQLLMTYSAAYVKLLVSDKLSVPANRRLQVPRNHCPAAPFCLCQFIKMRILD
ncbi:transmembrane protein 268 isoform X1 [Syngnathus acus]|uniref:transmembrane protein 268 isoform X1 n=1 Tax=Syngnathus acus TaxID=161584 RepID=UPI001885E233|nr:transmembrane protein 268 isoform X1 [Syngnathus acus]XP_037120396.1 transmembrane protein 268 isoform X1 [Syngnathus acus]